MTFFVIYIGETVQSGLMKFNQLTVNTLSIRSKKQEGKRGEKRKEQNRRKYVYVKLRTQ